MSRVLLDSNIIIYSIDPQDRVSRACISKNKVCCSAVSAVETLGFHGLLDNDQVHLEKFFGTITVFPVDQNVIDEAIRLRQLKRMGLGDALVAATALARELTLCTRNSSDFAGLPDLKLIDPHRSP